MRVTKGTQKTGKKSAALFLEPQGYDPTGITETGTDLLDAPIWEATSPWDPKDHP